MNTILNRVNQLTNALKRLLPMTEENRKRLDKKFRLEFSYNSNHLEGNTLTYGETELLLIFDETKNAVSHHYREYEEMKAHDVAFSLVKEWAQDKERPLTETNIKNLNEIILVRPFWKDALTPDGQNTRREIKVGDYKEYPNSVRLANGEIFDYASPAETPIAMGLLMAWYRREEEEAKLHPVELAALFHYKFVLIHPFDDGNGRISRLLMNYVLIRHDLPTVIIKSEDKSTYLQALHQADVGDIQYSIDYVAEQSAWSLDISIKAAKGESIDEPGDLDKKIALLKKTIGEDLNVRVTQRKSKETIGSVFENCLIPLVTAWEKRLQDFDPLFFSRNNRIKSDGNRSTEYNMNEMTVDFLKYHLDHVLFSEYPFGNLTISCQPFGLRKLRKEVELNGGEISLSFRDRNYEIAYSGNHIIINKLYHQLLSEEEIQLIVETLGTFLYNAIEKSI